MKQSELLQIESSLHRLERAVLPMLGKLSSVSELVEHTGLQEVEVMRALQWLQNKKVVKISEESQQIISLGENGRHYAKDLLPEAKFLETINSKPLSLPEIKRASNLSEEEVGASIGVLMRNKAIKSVIFAGQKAFEITSEGKELVSKGFPSQKFLTEYDFPIEISGLSKEEKDVVSNLIKRKGILKEDVSKNRTAKLTDLGKILSKKLKTGGKNDFVDRLTPKMLSSGEWRKLSFRSYDLSAPSPRIFFGKAQPYREFLEEVRETFVSLGFEEMSGPIVESEFWNMDALFMPQFHSARDIHDAYYIKEPSHTTNLPKELLRKVKAAHENGFGTGSKGWRYSFSEEKTARMIMRSQTTACSARKLADKSLKVPGKYFSIGRCFRYDVIDAKHLADFNQVEGIVIEKGINLKHLIGLLKLFAKEFCSTDKIRVVPSYFPFTEPSASLYAKHPELGWIELAGAGMFRPEMTRPLTGGSDPVIAWGIGIDRIAMFRLGLNDIRELFSHDLRFLRNAKIQR
jgi:phenylalanyl-tRNA synthetase alpha chain